jgi:hypothetical protein
MADPITRDDLRDVVTHEVRQHVTPYVLKLDNVADDVRMLKWTVYGNEAAGEAGLVKSMKSIQAKLDSLIESSAARDNQWKGIRNALIAVGTISSVPALQALGKLLGIWP